MSAQPVTHLLYLHGFRSGPQSTKARTMAGWMKAHHSAVEWLCPQLPASPREAFEQIQQATAAWPADRMAIVGSSLGGFYATALAEKRGCRAVLLNPAIEPARDLAKYVGETTAWHSEERFFFRPEFIDELRTIAPDALTCPERYYAVIAKGDEVLDWHEMTARYAGCRIKLLEGGDHALSDFDAHLSDLLRFIGLG